MAGVVEQLGRLRRSRNSLVQMPVSSMSFIGFAIDFDLIVDGASLVGFATAIRSLPTLAAHEGA
jgi:hypothetical protein